MYNSPMKTAKPSPKKATPAPTPKSTPKIKHTSLDFQKSKLSASRKFITWQSNYEKKNSKSPSVKEVKAWWNSKGFTIYGSRPL